MGGQKPRWDMLNAIETRVYLMYISLNRHGTRGVDPLHGLFQRHQPSSIGFD